jgi:hypothetical protein
VNAGQEPLLFDGESAVLTTGDAAADHQSVMRGGAAGQSQWLKTNAEGQASTIAPSPGRRIWRGTDLRLSTADPAVWESRFVTLAFEVQKAADPPS